MSGIPVVALLAFDFVVLVSAISGHGRSPGRQVAPLLNVLFFVSGMPALIYQIVWQRVLFAIYGVNAESVAVVVSAFILGLGLGSILGGWLSSRLPRQAIVLFGVSELGVALFGASSLHIFHWASIYTSGTSLPYTVAFSVLLLVFPTTMMGATLPLLVQHVIRFSGRIGHSVATLYFVNTFGSAVACYLCATFLLRDFGQSRSVEIAACLNLLVGSVTLVFARGNQGKSAECADDVDPVMLDDPAFPMGIAMLIAGVVGFVALGFEIAWFRVFALASADRAPAFAFLLSIYLAGIAAGSYISGNLMEGKNSPTILYTIGIVMLVAGTISVYLPPLVGVVARWNISFLTTAPAFFLASALLGSVFPLLCRLGVSVDDRAGRDVSLIYVSNIVGSTAGSLVIGFVLMNHFGLRQISLQLSFLAAMTGAFILLFSHRKFQAQHGGTMIAILISLLGISAASPLYINLFEKLIFRGAAVSPFASVIENRNGVISVTRAGAIFGGGVYDGYFNIDPINDVNMIVRAFALSAFHPAPKRMLEIGLSSGSWAQVFANHPDLESLDIVEINPGYLKLIPQYPAVRSLLQNKKVHIFIDDGRRWLLAHPGKHYDAIVDNNSFYWRDHSSDLLSMDFFRIIRKHLDRGGVYYFNTTGSDDVLATGLEEFPYGLRVYNFLAVSDSVLEVDKDRLLSVLQRYKIDNQLVFDPNRSNSQSALESYMELADSVEQPQVLRGIETSDSLRRRLGERLIITDDNMGWEWRTVEGVP
jgi:predicted membrane-bound spermidine synthase